MKRIILITLLCSTLQAANEISVFVVGADTCFSVVREPDGDVWYVSGQVFEVWGTGARDADDYDIALTDKTGGMFVGDFDANISAGNYHIVTHQSADATADDDDPAVWTEYGYWSGSAWTSGPYASELDGILEDTSTTLPDLIDAVDSNDLSAAQVNAEVDTALSDYDGPTRTEATTDKDAIITEVNANETKIDALNNITAAEVWAATVEGAYDYRDYIRLMASVLFGTASGGGTTNITFQDPATGLTDRIDETVDAMGNRTSVTLDPD